VNAPKRPRQVRIAQPQDTPIIGVIRAMHEILLTRKSTRPSVILPFHLMWFGRLSKRQGLMALQKGLIISTLESVSMQSERMVRLTKRGRRGLDPFLISANSDAPFLFAALLQEKGYVSDDPFFVYEKLPLAQTRIRRTGSGLESSNILVELKLEMSGII